MLQYREDIERREEETLAPCATRSSQTRGRVYAQEKHPLRTAFQRDRDRVVHSAAFRRMEYKTQVFIPHEQDHFRTRLTHTIEVAQIGRTLARNLRLNEDLVEAIALVHDLGHTPFGHSGEDVLNDLLGDYGGFNHNRQTLRVVDILEQRYPEHPGLNLSYEVREGIVKHETSVRITHPAFDPDHQPTLEAALVDIADEIAYNTHDIDDGLSAGIIVPDELAQADFFDDLLAVGPDWLSDRPDDYKRYALVRHLVDRMATDVIEEAYRRIKHFNITDTAAVHSAPERICSYSASMGKLVLALKDFLRNRLYSHPHLVAISRRAEATIKGIFGKIQADTLLMPPRFQNMLESERREIVIADYIAGMTDRYAEKMFGDLGG